jgi:hypothetical protein
MNDALWWEFDAIVTNSATSFAPGDIIVSRIDFVATGAIRLRAQTTAGRRLLQETATRWYWSKAATTYWKAMSCLRWEQQ